MTRWRCWRVLSGTDRVGIPSTLRAHRGMNSPTRSHVPWAAHGRQFAPSPHPAEDAVTLPSRLTNDDLEPAAPVPAEMRSTREAQWH